MKQKIWTSYREKMSTGIAALRRRLDDLAEALQEDTKSSAGDKYETSRAMVHMEQQNAAVQLAELEDKRNILDGIDIHASSDRVILGSLVITDKGYLFVCAALGKIIVEGQPVFALSGSAPLGRKIMGLKRLDRAELNGTIYTIEDII